MNVLFQNYLHLLMKADELVGFIQINKNDSSFKYKLYSNSVFNGFPPENALIYGSTLRYSSESYNKPYWAICFDNIAIKIKYYKFQEPDYESGKINAHQKSWIFYGSSQNDNSNYIAIDSHTNMEIHNQANYIGKYSVNITGPFKCFKIECIESYGIANLITFRSFDIFEKNSYINDINFLTSDLLIKIRTSLLYLHTIFIL